MPIIYTPQAPHRCDPPRDKVNSPFTGPYSFVGYPVGTVYQCDVCRDVHVVEKADRDFYGRVWVRKTEAQADPILRAIQENS